MEQNILTKEIIESEMKWALSNINEITYMPNDDDEVILKWARDGVSIEIHWDGWIQMSKNSTTIGCFFMGLYITDVTIDISLYKRLKNSVESAQVLSTDEKILLETLQRRSLNSENRI